MDDSLPPVHDPVVTQDVPSRPWPFAITLFFGTLVLGGMVFDHRPTLDSPYFLSDARVVDGDVGEMFRTDWWNHGANQEGMLHEGAGLYRPVTLIWLSAFHGLTSSSQHAEGRCSPVNIGNVLLHAIGVGLRFFLLLLILDGLPRAQWFAFLGAAILAVHTVCTDAIATQVGAAEGLSVVFSSGALLVLLRTLRGGGKWGWWVHPVLLLLALLAKESAVAFAGAAFLLAWLVAGRSIARAGLCAIPAALATVAWLLLRIGVLGSATGVGDPVLVLFDPVARFATAFAVIFVYDLPALLWPFHLHPQPNLQDIPPATGFGDPRAFGGLMVVVILLAGFAVTVRRAPRVAFGLGFLGGMLLPVSNLVVEIGALAATRFLYLPVTGLAVAVAAGGARLAGSPGGGWRRGIGFALVGWFLVVPLVATVLELPRWKDAETLWRTTSERWPDSGQAHYNLGVEQRERGRGTGGLAAFVVAAYCPLPTIPGHDGQVHEDALDLSFQAAMNAAGQTIANGQAASITDAGNAIRRSDELFGRAADLARRGLALGDDANTNWRVSVVDALLGRVQVRTMRLQLVAEEQRPAAVSRIREFIQKARDVAPGSLRVELAEARLGSQWPSRLEALYARAMRATSVSDARAVVDAYVKYLLQSNRGAEAGARFLEAVLAGVVEADSAEVLRAALSAAASRDPAVRAIAKRGLERVLGLRGTSPADARKARDALRRL